MENEPIEQGLPVYPKATTDGFCFLDDEEEAMGVETKTYENGSEVKRVKLKDGRIATIRELKAWEMEEAERFHKGNQDHVMMAVAAKAVKIDDKNVAFEDIKMLRGKDWTPIKKAIVLTNFL